MKSIVTKSMTYLALYLDMTCDVDILINGAVFIQMIMWTEYPEYLWYNKVARHSFHADRVD